MNRAVTFAEYWRIAYKRLHGMPAPRVMVRGGWATIDGIRTKFRERALGEMAQELDRQFNERHNAAHDASKEK